MTDFNHKNREGDYRSIFDNAIEGIFQSSLEGRYLQVNPAMAQIYGYESPDEMVKLVTDMGKSDNPKFWPNVSFSGNVLEQYFKTNRTGYFSTTSGIACRRAEMIERAVPAAKRCWGPVDGA